MMEKEYMTSSDSAISKKEEGSTTKGPNGKKSSLERIAEGRAWGARKRAEGWEETPDGLQPMLDIQQAGYIKNSSGQWCIPSEEYISDGNDESRPAGQKYFGPSRKYLGWRRRHDAEYGKGKEKDSGFKFVEELASPTKL